MHVDFIEEHSNVAEATSMTSEAALLAQLQATTDSSSNDANNIVICPDDLEFMDDEAAQSPKEKDLTLQQ